MITWFGELGVQVLWDLSLGSYRCFVCHSCHGFAGSFHLCHAVEASVASGNAFVFFGIGCDVS